MNEAKTAISDHLTGEIFTSGGFMTVVSITDSQTVLPSLEVILVHVQTGVTMSISRMGNVSVKLLLKALSC